MKLEPIKVDGHLLWPDGMISVDPAKITEYIFKMGVKNLSVTEMTPEIKEYNEYADQPLTVKTSCSINLPPAWTVPERYKYIDLDEYLLGLVDKIEKDSLYEKRVERLAHEIWLFKSLQLENVLRVLIYVIDVFTERQIVWGVGRGSSCSSYLLYVLGLHEVDPVKYDIDITDFIRDTGEYNA